MLWPKKHSYKEFHNEKKFLQLENSPSPPPPITFLMVRPLITNAYVNRTYTSGLVNIVLFSIISFFTRCNSQSIWERICFSPLEDWDRELASSASSSFVSK